jgi:4-hydroxy-2-oxoheptanedioate aldolase
VLIDLEHGSGTETALLSQLQALEATKAAPVVRVENNERIRINRTLDLGAEGIMCPRINQVDEARSFAEALHYLPGGNRGVAKMIRAAGFSRDFNSYRENSKKNILGIVQIETPEVLDHLDEIAGLEHVDVLFIGPADLSMSLGIFDQFEHPLFTNALKATVKAVEKAGKAAGILLFNPDDFSKYHDLGFRLIACGADAKFVLSVAKQVADSLNKQADKNTS